MITKRCSVCQEEKLLTDFYKEKRVKDGRQAKCKICHCKTTNSYRERNLSLYSKASKKYWDKLSNSKKQHNWLKRYNLTIEEYEKMCAKQKNVCCICKQKCNTRKTLSVDHDHKTGKIRGLLCVKCNTALGMLNDNIGTFENAINYLRNFEESL